MLSLYCIPSARNPADNSPKEAYLFPESKGFGLGMANAFEGW
jgi:hypothetical protein